MNFKPNNGPVLLLRIYLSINVSIPFVARYLSRHEKIKTPRPDGPVVQKRKIRKPEINSTCPVTEGYLATIYDNRPFRIRPATAQVPTFSNYVIQDVKKKIARS